jgi:hypothetical protein
MAIDRMERECQVAELLLCGRQGAKCRARGGRFQELALQSGQSEVDLAHGQCLLLAPREAETHLRLELLYRFRGRLPDLPGGDRLGRAMDRMPRLGSRTKDQAPGEGQRSGGGQEHLAAAQDCAPAAAKRQAFDALRRIAALDHGNGSI